MLVQATGQEGPMFDYLVVALCLCFRLDKQQLYLCHLIWRVVGDLKEWNTTWIDFGRVESGAKVQFIVTGT